MNDELIEFLLHNCLCRFYIPTKPMLLRLMKDKMKDFIIIIVNIVTKLYFVVITGTLLSDNDSTMFSFFCISEQSLDSRYVIRNWLQSDVINSFVLFHFLHSMVILLNPPISTTTTIDKVV